MSTLSTHALDTATGKPAKGLNVMLEKQSDPKAWLAHCQSRLKGDTSSKPQWQTLATGVTNSDGRVPGFLPEGTGLKPGIYRMDFDTATYFEKWNITGFYPLVQIIFEIKATDEHYHIPLLISPYGYSTYRGS